MAEKNNSIELTVLMPCLNEVKTIGGCIEEARQFICENGLQAEIVVVDNGSTDGSAAVAQNMGARVIVAEKKGYGNALIAGINGAKGTYIIMGDCDLSYDFYHLSDFLDKLREGCDLVMGNRFTGDMEHGAMSFSHRYIGVPFLSFAGRKRYHTKVKDFHCGLRGFRREKALQAGLQCGGMEFATEMIAEFSKKGFTIAEVPVSLRRDARDGRSHLRSIPDGLRHLRYILFGLKKKSS